MSANSKIEWTDHTFNPWIGCTRVSTGCDNCYAAVSTPVRTMRINWGAHATRHRTAHSTWAQPKQWNDQHEAFQAKHGRRQRVFCASLADVFDNAVDPTWRHDLWQLIQDTPNLDWLLLTKRVGNVFEMLPDGWAFHSAPWPNVWIGATIVDQEEADRDIPKLVDIPAARRFLSMEPLLGATNIQKWLDPFTCADCGFHGDENSGGPDGCEKCGETFGDSQVCQGCGADDQSAKRSCPRCGSHRSFDRDYGFKFDSEKKLIDWVIVGGESGPGARPMHPDWARSLRDQCAAAGVPFLFKQWGEWAPDEHFTSLRHEMHEWGEGLEITGRSWRAGKKAAGRLLDGITHDGFPS